GSITLAQSPRDEVILIAQNWQKQKRGEMENNGAYLSCGYSKVAIRGMIGSQSYAIFISKALGNAYSTDEENTNELLAEFKVLWIADYFLETFKKRATVNGYKGLPNIRFNTAGSFIGTLVSPVPEWNESSKIKDNRSLYYSTFMAAPLLDLANGWHEEKWSGTCETGDNETHVARVLNAFSHHSLIDSANTCLLVDLQGASTSPDGDIILFDPQAHTTWPGAVGFFDKKQSEIDRFSQEHVCNEICKALKLSAKDPKTGKSTVKRPHRAW
ncbi:kinase-like domain-containing protein, partial [Hygrophoropsis aurantiaca]